MPATWMDYDRTHLRGTTNALSTFLDTDEVFLAFKAVCSKASYLLCNAHRASRCFRYSFALLFPAQVPDQFAPLCIGSMAISPPRDSLEQQMERLALDDLKGDAEYVLELDYTHHGALLDEFDQWYEKVIAGAKDLAAAIGEANRLVKLVGVGMYDSLESFRPYWQRCLTDVYQWAEDIHQPETFWAPTLANVLHSVAAELPHREKVSVVAEMEGQFERVAWLTTDHVDLPDNGAVYDAIMRDVVRVGDLGLGGMSVRQG